MSVFVHARHLPASAHAPQVGERAPDFTLPDESGALISLAALLSPTPVSGAPASKGVLLVFSMYAGCRACNSEYRGIQQHLADFSAMGVRPVVISIDPPDISRALSREAGYTFTFLSDPSLAVIRRYDVANGEEARPAEFLLDSTGIVRWRNLTNSMFVRARPGATARGDRNDAVMRNHGARVPHTILLLEMRAACGQLCAPGRSFERQTIGLNAGGDRFDTGC